MIATPAIDLRRGRCVQLVGGRPEDERIALPDPVAEAVAWHRLGFESLHIVDLDAAMGDGDNSPLIETILHTSPAEKQVGGGIRDDGRAGSLLRAGADRIVVGTRALDDPAWLEDLAEDHPNRVVVAVDTRDGRVLRKGWAEETALDVSALFERLADSPLAGILSTDVGREGRLEGIDRPWCARVVRESPHPVWISGGVTTVEELEFLEDVGARGVVLGMAIYTNTLNREVVARRWGALARESV